MVFEPTAFNSVWMKGACVKLTGTRTVMASMSTSYFRENIDLCVYKILNFSLNNFNDIFCFPMHNLLFLNTYSHLKILHS